MIKKIIVLAIILSLVGYFMMSGPPREIKFDGATLKLHRAYERNGDKILEYTQDGETRAYAKKLIFIATSVQGITSSSPGTNWPYYLDHFALKETKPRSENFFSVSKTLNPDFSQGVYAIKKSITPGLFMFFREVVETENSKEIKRLHSAKAVNFRTLDTVYQQFSQ